MTLDLHATQKLSMISVISNFSASLEERLNQCGEHFGFVVSTVDIDYDVVEAGRGEHHSSFNNGLGSVQVLVGLERIWRETY